MAQMKQGGLSACRLRAGCRGGLPPKGAPYAAERHSSTTQIVAAADHLSCPSITSTCSSSDACSTGVTHD